MLTGRIKVWKRDRGFGFIRRDDGEGDVFCHASAVEQAGIVGGLVEGDAVRFLICTTRDGRAQAAEIELVSRGDRLVSAGGRI